MASTASAGGAGARGVELPRWAAWLAALAVAALFAWNVQRSWFQSDDAFISFRYARNLVDGHGLVWNPGERVEGYTNFAWVLLMAAGMRLGLAPELASNGLAVACGTLLLLAVLRFAGEGRSLRSPWPWLLVLVLATSGSFTAWCTGGLETMLFTLLAFLGLTRLLAPWPRPARGALVAALCFAGAALTRPEGILFGALAAALLALDVLRRRRPPAALLAFLAPCVAIVGAHLLWRRAYYGEWLPNTFHAKVPGLWLEQGWRYFRFFHDGYRIGWFLPLAALALSGPDRRRAASLACVLAVYATYVLCVGGDWFELRFLVQVFPLLYWLLVEGLAVLAEGGGAHQRRGRGAAAALVAALLLLTTHLGFGRVPGNEYNLQSVEGTREYCKRRVEEGLFLRAKIEAGELPRELVLAVGGAGAVPYYTGWTTVDRRGLNDHYIARLPVERRGNVAHEHDAPFAYLAERRVAVFDVLNKMLVKREALSQLREQAPFLHDGRELKMRVIPFGNRCMLFATFVSDAELWRLFPRQRILALEED